MKQELLNKQDIESQKDEISSSSNFTAIKKTSGNSQVGKSEEEKADESRKTLLKYFVGGCLGVLLLSILILPYALVGTSLHNAPSPNEPSKNQKRDSELWRILMLCIAAALTAICMYPVDVIRALKMASAGSENPMSIKDFIKTHGLKGLVKQGALAEIIKSSLMRASKFFFFGLFCKHINGTTMATTPFYIKGPIGMLATFPEIFIVTPLEVAKIALQIDSENKFKNSVFAALKHMYKTHGFAGVYSGWFGMQLRNGIWTGLFFMMIGFFRKPFNQWFGLMGATHVIFYFLAKFISAFIAGSFATVFNTPPDVVRSVVQRQMIREEPSESDESKSCGGKFVQHFASHFKVFGDLVSKSGILGVYPGFGFKALHLGGSGGLMILFIVILQTLMDIKYGI